MHHIIYKTTNVTNGKIYIGVHSTENIEDGYLGSGTALLAAVEKYGHSSFKKDVLYKLQSREEALLIEKAIVDHVFIKRSDVYNLIPGPGPAITYNSIQIEGSIQPVEDKSDYYVGHLLHSIYTKYGESKIEPLRVFELATEIGVTYNLVNPKFKAPPDTARELSKKLSLYIGYGIEMTINDSLKVTYVIDRGRFRLGNRRSSPKRYYRIRKINNQAEEGVKAE